MLPQLKAGARDLVAYHYVGNSAAIKDSAKADKDHLRSLVLLGTHVDTRSTSEMLVWRCLQHLDRVPNEAVLWAAG